MGDFQSSGYDQVIVHCTDRGMDLKADVLSKSERHMTIILENTDFKITLSRDNVTKPFVGTAPGGFEFVYVPKDQ